MILVACPHCEKRIVGSDNFAGQYRECPGCGDLFVALPVNDDGSADLRNAMSGSGEIRLPPARKRVEVPQREESRVEAQVPEPDHKPEVVEEETPVESVVDAEVSTASIAASLPKIALQPEVTDPEDSERLSVWMQTLQSKESRSYLISTAVHAVLLLIFAAWILPRSPETKLPGLITVLPENMADQIVDTVEFDAAPEEVAIEPPEPVVPVEMAVADEPDLFEVSKIGDLPSLDAKPEKPKETKRESSKDTTRGEPGPEPTEATVSQATSVEGATDAIIESIKSKLLERDTAVIWLMDRSLSMQRQRNMLADRLEGYLNEVHETRTDESHSLMHMVVAFGDRFEKFVVTPEPRRALAAIRKDYGLDPTGKENVFSAIEWCEDQFVRKNGKNRQKNLLCVVCTDESGDDYLRLEQTIQTCRASRLEVSVIGPSAVLGQMRGYHGYTANDNRLYYLPVFRGPDTALPQRIRLPYWFRKVPIYWDESRRGPWYGNMPSWQGGSNHDAMLSGFGPYALTRLTMATGGDYILYDRPGDSSPFQIETLRPYLPDYRSADVIQADLSDKPLRLAILKAVEASHQLKLQEPRLDYGVQFNGSFYYSAQVFQARVRGEVAAEKPRAEAAVQALDQLIGLFENRVVDGLYESEESPRWKAWYDLTYGRLLASRVRFQVFVEFAANIDRARFEPTTNGMSLRPVKLPEEFQRLTREADARRILQRCVDSNPETPWFHLARRELKDNFGLTIKERTVPGAIRSPVGRPPKVSLPQL
ncbi:MAG: hypothetical protein ACI8P0_001142 [Planctomycetaceae bacterium]